LGFATDGLNHALIWNGTAASVTDLHPYLAGLGPAFTESYALGISDLGVIVGYAYDGSTNYAVLWTPVPEPGSAALLLALIGVALVRARRQ
jgi:hypothetical protein